LTHIVSTVHGFRLLPAGEVWEVLSVHRLSAVGGYGWVPYPPTALGCLGGLVTGAAGFGCGDLEARIELDGGVGAVRLGDVGFVGGAAVVFGGHVLHRGAGVGGQYSGLHLCCGVTGEVGFVPMVAAVRGGGGWAGGRGVSSCGVS